MLKGKKIALSIVAAATMTFVGCGGGSSSNNSTPTKVTGTSIDGYISGALVKLDGKTAKTDANGKWTITVPTALTKTSIVSTTGGTDTATGAKFEGRISAIASANEQVVVTPVTSLVVPLVKQGKSATKAEASIAKQIGVPVTSISADPIKALKSKTPADKLAAQKVIKTALLVQKIAEGLAKSVSAADSKQFLSTTDAVFASIATELSKGQDISAVVANVDKIASNVATILQKNGDSSKLLASKLQAAAAVVKEVAQQIQAIQPSEIDTNTLSKVSKAVEIVSSTVEAKIVQIAKATDDTQIKAAELLH